MDANSVIRLASVGTLAADESIAAYPIAPMVHPLYLHTIVPAVSSGDTFKVNAIFKDDSTELKRCVGPAIAAAGHHVLEIFCDHPSLDSLVVTNDVTLDSTVAGNFGAVIQYLSNSRHS